MRTSRRRVAPSLLVCGLLVTACADDSNAPFSFATSTTTDTTPATTGPPTTAPASTAPPTTDVAATTAPATTAPPTNAPPTTAAATTTAPTTATPTTAAPDTTAPTTAAPTTVAGPDDAPAHSAADVEAGATAAVAAAVALGYGAEVTPSDPEVASDILFGPCLDEGDFDLDELDPVTTAAFDASVEGATTAGVLEIRAFDEQATAEDAFDVLAKIFGTDDGRACFAELAAEAMGGEVDITVEPLVADGVDVGISLTADLGGLLFFLDYAATLRDDCTFFGAYQGFDEPIDPVLVADMFTAALA